MHAACTTCALPATLCPLAGHRFAVPVWQLGAPEGKKAVGADCDTMLDATKPIEVEMQVQMEPAVVGIVFPILDARAAASIYQVDPAEVKIRHHSALDALALAELAGAAG